jgi:predicted naringenin-chalcone synthase
MQNLKGVIKGYRSILPPVPKPQGEAIEWLANAHAVAIRHSQQNASDPKQIHNLFSRFGCKPAQIDQRFSVLEDFRHTDFEKMEIYHLSRNPRGAGSSARTRFFSRVVSETFDRFYSEECAPPAALFHVTCTGYDAPSGAERLVARKGWGDQTEVYHLYHMGCYAAIPALRIAQCLTQGRIDIAHTELCSIHLDPTNHSPEQMAIQSLFADGLIRYSVDRKLAQGHWGLEHLTTRKELIRDSEDAMTWGMGDHGMEMTLSRKVPDLIASHLYSFLERLVPWDDQTIFAIHPGGPRIVDQIQSILRLSDAQVGASRKVLSERGNMSSATLPHIWMKLLDDPTVAEGTKIISLAFGPGLTLCGNVLRKIRA